MKNEPIFELFRDPQRKTGHLSVKIYVSWNGKRILLIDALKNIENAFMDDPEIEWDNYKWAWAESLYGQIIEAKNDENKLFSPVCSSRRFKFIETETQIIWSGVLFGWTDNGPKILTPEDGILPKGFHTFPVYPDFVFDKAQFYEELEIMRPLYEEEQRRRAEFQADSKRRGKLDRQWDEETLKNDTIDYASFSIPKHSGPIFKMVESENNIFAEIYVDWQGKRMSLIDVLKIWEKPFDEELAGNYTWCVAADIYRALVVEVQQKKPFHKILCCFGCGDVVCWPFRIEVKETDDLVIWTNFRQPHRNKYSFAGFWDYSVYPPFVFDKKQYYEELEQMRPDYERQEEQYARWKAENPDASEPIEGY